MPRRLDRDEMDRFLSGRHVGVLATVGGDGFPALTPIWYLYREGKLLMRTGERSVKARNVRSHPRVSLCVQNERPPYKSVTVYGTASIQESTPGLGAQMANRYLGKVGGLFYLRLARDDVEQSAEVTLVVTPERVVSQDFSPETPAVGRLWLLAKRVLPPWL